MANQEQNKTKTNHDNQKVLISRTMVVHPSSPLPREKVILLSNLDRKCPQLMYLVFFYRSSPPHNMLFNSLKYGLEKTLSDWYPAAGRLIINPDNGKLDLLCDNNSGALLVEAFTKVHIYELGDLSQYNEFYESLVVSSPLSPANLSQMPLLVAQVTKFGCGGYSVGIGTSHSIFDGVANFNFIKAWAQNAAGRAKKEESDFSWFEPVHERGRLLVGIKGHGKEKKLQAETQGNIMMKRVIAFDHLRQLIMQTSSSLKSPMEPYNRSTSSAQQEEFVLRTFSLSSTMVEKLKREVASGSKVDGGSCSSFEVVAAHLWKARTKALGIAKEKMACLQFTMDIRNKMDPPLPQSFSGNAFVLCSVACTAGEIINIKLTTLVDKIKEAKLVVTEEYIQAYLKALEAPQGELPPLPELTMVSDWQRMPYHQVDFCGRSGAIYVSPLGSPVQQVAFFMQRPGDVGGVDVRIGLPKYSLLAFSHHFIQAL